jgi:hypothetical protein
MTKRNVMWLVVLVAVGVIVAISVSLVWGWLQLRSSFRASCSNGLDASGYEQPVESPRGLL